jgi:hypothetical protein
MIEEVQEITAFYSTFLSRQAGLMKLLRAAAMPCVSFPKYMTTKQACGFAIPSSISHLWTSRTQDAFANAGGGTSHPSTRLSACYHQQYLSSGIKQARCAFASSVALFLQVAMADSDREDLVCVSAMLRGTFSQARRILELRRHVFSIPRTSRDAQSQARTILYWQNRLCRRHLHLDWHGSPVSELNTKHSLSGVMMI